MFCRSICLSIALAASSSSAIAQEQIASPPVLACPLDRPYDQTNPFARILRGELPASRIFEDDQAIVIVPLGWDYPGHALVIPKGPIRSLLDMTPAQMGHVLDVARRTGIAQQSGLGATGFTVAQNNARNQDVCHAHFHVVPNTPREPTQTATREQMDEIAQRLRDAFPER